MTWVAAAFLVVAFLVLLQLLRVPAAVADLGTVSSEALRTFRDASLSDADKEKAMRAGSLRLFGLFLRIAGATVLALLLPAGLLWLLDIAGVLDLAVVLERTLSWQVLLGATILGVFVMRLLARQTS